VSELSSDPGLITRIENGWMHVKVPVGLGCRACPNKTVCTFSGPDRAYRTFRIRHVEGCQTGDRVLVNVPISVLGVTALVMLGLPIVMILGGYGLLDCCVKFPNAMVLLWLAGAVMWLAAMYGANHWMEHSARFRERVQPVAELLREPGETAGPISEDPG
jgi:positive regulator of sigma E activity